MQRIKICTMFDITPTGILRVHKHQQLPATINNKVISTVDEWNKLRKQQSNWQTMLQVLCLRTQPFNITNPIKQDNKWCFYFDNLTEDVFLDGANILGHLHNDINGIPMIIGLDEEDVVQPYITTYGDEQNTWIEVV